VPKTGNKTLSNGMLVRKIVNDRPIVMRSGQARWDVFGKANLLRCYTV
jgi:hypothetical protein